MPYFDSTERFIDPSVPQLPQQQPSRHYQAHFPLYENLIRRSRRDISALGESLRDVALIRGYGNAADELGVSVRGVDDLSVVNTQD